MRSSSYLELRDPLCYLPLFTVVYIQPCISYSSPVKISHLSCISCDLFSSLLFIEETPSTSRLGLGPAFHHTLAFQNRTPQSIRAQHKMLRPSPVHNLLPSSIPTSRAPLLLQSPLGSVRVTYPLC